MKRFRSLVVGAVGAVSLLVAAATLVPASPPDGQARHFDIVREDGVELAMRDGVTLRAVLFRPQAEGRFPAIVYRTPYGAAEYASYADLPRKAARRGYLVFLVDVRGRYASDGEFEAYRNEKRDGYDTIEAVAAHPRSDGRVGTYGGSYPGYVQWLALSQAPPHLTTAVPAMTPVDSHHFFYQGGAFNLTWYEWFLPLIFPDLRRRAGDEDGPWDTEAAYERWVRERQAREWYFRRPLMDVPLLRPYAPYYYEWLAHPDRSDWWDFADVQSYFDRIEAPVLNVSGWFDNNYGPTGATRGFSGVREHGATELARTQTRLVMGPWNHASLDVHKTRTGDLEFGPSAGIDYDDFLMRWFDRWLKGIDNGVDREPPVRIFVMGENEWRAEREWPLARAVETSLYLASGGSATSVFGDGRLSFEPPDAAGDPAAFDRYVFDPTDPVWDPHFETSGPFDQLHVERRQDVLVYTSPPLEEDLEVTGEVEVELWLSSDAPDTDFGFMLCDVHPDGRSYNLAGPEAGYLRMRYREGFDRQVLMEPGRVYRVRFGNLRTSNVFRAGHRIRLQVTSSRAPHFDPNPNTGTEIATEARLVSAEQTVYHDAERPSRLVLPVVPRE